MEVIEVLREASRRVYRSVDGLAGTRQAAGDFGRGAGGDISRRIDIIAERAVLDYLREVRFGCVVLGEECGRVEIGNGSEGYVIMDAVDGSANAVRGMPFFCSSLAFAPGERLSTITDGVVMNLSGGGAYWATAGGGAFLDGTPISVHRDDPVYRIVGVNVSGATSDLLDRLHPVFEGHNHIRHLGANALEMAMFASGLMDVFIDLRCKIRVQDIAAGYVISREAGGILLDGQMEPLDSDLGYDTRISFIAAASQKVLDETMRQIRPS